MTAFSVNRFEPRRSHSGRSVRPAAQAGRFYPGQTDAIEVAIEKHLAADPLEQAAAANYRAVMLPHAGWLYCGDTIGKTLRRMNVPRTVIVIGPKHTRHGAAWSIAPHQTWQLPGTQVPIATDLARRLLDSATVFQCEADAHKLEHGTEVLLPFLRRMNKQLRVLPVVIGPVDSYAALAPLSDALVEILRRSEDPPLLVISSDMNHFATEPENRRLDHMALDAMLTGDPRHLYDVVKHHGISMCGVHPAVAIMQALDKLGGPLTPQLIDYRNSATVTGNTSSVVGYAGVLIK